jgi:hypothetical protein
VSARDDVLDRVREYRVAARKIVRADWVPVKRRCLGLLELADAARAESDLTTRTWAERSIWEESKAFLEMEDTDPVLPARRIRAPAAATAAPEHLIREEDA